jgi:hypothetical protein
MLRVRREAICFHWEQVRSRESEADNCLQCSERDRTMVPGSGNVSGHFIFHVLDILRVCQRSHIYCRNDFLK